MSCAIETKVSKVGVGDPIDSLLVGWWDEWSRSHSIYLRQMEGMDGLCELDIIVHQIGGKVVIPVKEYK